MYDIVYGQTVMLNPFFAVAFLKPTTSIFKHHIKAARSGSSEILIPTYQTKLYHITQDDNHNFSALKKEDSQTGEVDTWVGCISTGKSCKLIQGAILPFCRRDPYNPQSGLAGPSCCSN
jgi:hypothetical protein